MRRGGGGRRSSSESEGESERLELYRMVGHGSVSGKEVMEWLFGRSQGHRRVIDTRNGD